LVRLYSGLRALASNPGFPRSSPFEAGSVSSDWEYGCT
jgi:hypothetical protein